MQKGIKPTDYYYDEDGKVHPVFSIDWHYVGATGEPAFQNSWTNVGGSYQTCRFGKLPNGELWIEGRITGGAMDTVAFTLPEGYRSSGQMIFNTASATSGYVEIYTNGDVKIVS